MLSLSRLSVISLDLPGTIPNCLALPPPMWSTLQGDGRSRDPHKTEQELSHLPSMGPSCNHSQCAGRLSSTISCTCCPPAPLASGGRAKHSARSCHPLTPLPLSLHGSAQTSACIAPTAGQSPGPSVTAPWDPVPLQPLLWGLRVLPSCHTRFSVPLRRAPTPSFSLLCRPGPSSPRSRPSPAPHGLGLLSRPSAFNGQSSTPPLNHPQPQPGSPALLAGPLSGHPSRYHRDVARADGIRVDPDSAQSELSVRGGVHAPAQGPSASSVSLLSVLRQQEGGSQASVYLQPQRGGVFQPPGLAESDGGTDSGQNNSGSIRHRGFSVT